VDAQGMLIEFDQNTIANMTAALDFVCKNIPPERDSVELRKRIAGKLMECAREGRHSFAELQQAGIAALQETESAGKSGWLAAGSALLSHYLDLRQRDR
jgi:hypothetical protein